MSSTTRTTGHAQQWAAPCAIAAFLAVGCTGTASGGGTGDAGTGSTDSSVATPSGDASSGGDTARDGSVAPRDASSGADGSPVSPGDATAPAPAPAGSFNGHWLMGYYDVAQADVLPPESIPWEDLTHLIVDLGPQALSLSGTQLTVSNAAFDIDGARRTGADALQRLSALARAHDVQPLLHIGGYDSWAIEAMAKGTQPGNVPALVAELTTRCSELGFAGVDWEQYGFDDSTSIARAGAFLKALREAAPDLVLASDGLGAGHTTVLPGLIAEAARTLAPLLDYMLLRMTDGIGNDAPWTVWHYVPLFNRPESEAGGHLFSMEMGVQLFTQASPSIGIARANLGVELPMWGIGLGPKSPTSPGAMMTEPGVPLAGPNDWSLFAWGRNPRDWPIRRIQADYATPASEHWDDDAKASYLSFWPPIAATGYSSETLTEFRYLTFVSFESARAAALKGAYLRCNQLGGAVVRSLNDATLANGENPVLRALANALKTDEPGCP